MKTLLSIPALFMVLVLVLMSGCATTSQTTDTQEKNPDPFEKVNRVTFAFNDKLDAWLLKPVAKSYRFIAPNFVEQGVSNFFSNLGEVSNIVNDVLQWKWAQASNDTGRFLLNSTFGLAGFLDLAPHAGLPEGDGESFGQTFSHWGIPAGPYLVLPFLGSSTVTDTVSLPLSWQVNPITYVDDEEVRLGLVAMSAIDARANLLDAESLISGDRYLFIRNAFLQRREYLVNDGEVDLSELEEGLDDFDGFDEDF